MTSEIRKPEEDFSTPPLFSKKTLRLIFLASLLIAGLVFTFSLLTPTILETGTARYLVCLLLSLCLAIAFFVFWPQRLELTKIPYTEIPLRVTGPIALWLAVFSLFLTTMPREDVFARVFTPIQNGKEYVFLYDRGTKLQRNGAGPAISYQLIESRDKLGELLGIYVEFEKGEDSFSAWLTHHGFDPVLVTFSREASTFDVSLMKKRED
jgi:hypothetical protein